MRFFYVYVYVRMLNMRQWTSLRVLSTRTFTCVKKPLEISKSLENSLNNIYVRASIHLLTLIKTLLTISRHLLLFYLSFVEHSLAVQKRIPLYANFMEFYVPFVSKDVFRPIPSRQRGTIFIVCGGLRLYHAISCWARYAVARLIRRGRFRRLSCFIIAFVSKLQFVWEVNNFLNFFLSFFLSLVIRN